MSFQCQVPGCTKAADFRVFLYDRYETSPHRPITYHEPDRHTPHICAPHAVLNELNAERPRRLYGRYPFTKLWEGERGYSIYKILPKASKFAYQIQDILPTKPRVNHSGGVGAEGVRAVVEIGRLKPEQPCSFDGCPFPQAFEVWKFEIGPVGLRLTPHPVGKVCGDHAVALGREFPLTVPKRPALIYRSLLAMPQWLPKELEARVFEFEEPSEGLLQKLLAILSRAA